MNSENISRYHLVAFAAPAFVTSLMYGPMVGILPTIYAKYFGLDLALIGSVLLFSRIFDAVTDPLIGYLSDHTKTRIGRRKPWILAGYLLATFAVYALFVPPENVSGTYFMVSFILFYLFLTMAEIPYSAWQVELSTEYKQRTRVVTYRNVSQQLGLVMFTIVPMLPIFLTSGYTPEVFRAMAWITIVLLPPTVLASVIIVPEGEQSQKFESTKPTKVILALLKNKPFLYLMVCFMLFGFGGSIYGTAAFMFFDTYLLMGDKFPILMLAALIGGVAAMPFWLKMMNRYGRHRIWAICAIFGVLLLPLYLLFEVNTQVFIPLMLLGAVISAFMMLGNIAPIAMLGDVIDYDTLKSNESRSAQYYSILTLVQKGIGAFGSGLGFFILKLFQYNPASTTHAANSVFGLKLVLVGIPIALLFISAIAIWFFPIDERRHSIIKRRIEQRSKRAQRKSACD